MSKFADFQIFYLMTNRENYWNKTENVNTCGMQYSIGRNEKSTHL